MPVNLSSNFNTDLCFIDKLINFAFGIQVACPWFGRFSFENSIALKTLETASELENECPFPQPNGPCVWGGLLIPGVLYIREFDKSKDKIEL